MGFSLSARRSLWGCSRWSCGVWQVTATHLSPLEPASWSDSAAWRKPFWQRTVTGLSSYPLFVPSLFDFFFCQTNCQPKCFMGLSAAQVRAASERPKGLVFVSIDVHAGVIHSQSRRSQRVLGLWIPVHAGVFPRRSFHADDGDDIIARAIFAVGALVAMVVGTVQVFHAYTCDDPLWNLFP